MNSHEFKAAREELGLTIDELGAILGIRADTIRRRWEGSDLGPSPTAVKVVEWMLEGYRPPEWPDRLQPRRGLLPGRVRCMDCRCNGDGSCPGETLESQRRWREQMESGL